MTVKIKNNKILGLTCKKKKLYLLKSSKFQGKFIDIYLSRYNIKLISFQCQILINDITVTNIKKH